MFAVSIENPVKGRGNWPPTFGVTMTCRLYGRNLMEASEPQALLPGTFYAKRLKRTYTWDVPGRLIKVADNTVAAGYYAYDGLGRRVQSFENTYPVYYGYIGTETLSELPLAGHGLPSDYVYGAGLRIARFYYNGISNVPFYCHTGALGSTRLTPDASHSILFSDNYRPFGQDNSASGSERYKFTCKPVSQTTGLYYNLPATV